MTLMLAALQKQLKKKLTKGVWDMTKQKVDVQVSVPENHIGGLSPEVVLAYWLD
jgi:F0F1-type ATP synthase delta subunit